MEKRVKIGTKFGRLGTAVEKPSLKILDTTGYYLESKINRGVLSKAVVVSKNGKLITTYSSKNFDKAVVNIIQQAKK